MLRSEGAARKMNDVGYQVYISDVSGQIETLDITGQLHAKVAFEVSGVDSKLEDQHATRRAQEPLISHGQRLWTSLAEPPDSSCRYILQGDQEAIDKLLEDHRMHFTERCLVYQFYDSDLEYALLSEYEDWILGKQKEVEDSKHGAQVRFYKRLLEDVSEDVGVVSQESEIAWSEIRDWRRQNGDPESWPSMGERNTDDASTTSSAARSEYGIQWGCESDSESYATANEEQPSPQRPPILQSGYQT